MEKRWQRKPLSEAASDDSMYHGGIVSVSGPFGDDAGKKAGDAGEAFSDSITRGMDALENGSSPFAADVEPMPNAAVEVFDIFDVATGQHHMIWRVACRERAKYAN